MATDIACHSSRDLEIAYICAADRSATRTRTIVNRIMTVVAQEPDGELRGPRPRWTNLALSWSL